MNIRLRKQELKEKRRYGLILRYLCLSETMTGNLKFYLENDKGFLPFVR